MALINCSERGKQMSDKAASCLNCGNPINNRSNIPNSSNEELMKCPKCNSTQLTSNKAGFSGGKALAGAALTGGIGLLAGTIGSRNIDITCMKCGFRFKAGDYDKECKKLNRPSDSEVINQNPLRFFIIFFSLLSAIFIPLFGGSWWFLLIMPIAGFILLIIIESFTSKPSIRTYGDNDPRPIPMTSKEIDNHIIEYLKKDQRTDAILFYRSREGCSKSAARDYVDQLASNLES